jgi:CRISPR type III-A-associated RAMP protein Csm4
MNANERKFPGFIARLRPVGPWRFGSAAGSRDQVDRIYHSDSLYSAIASAMDRLGRLEEWLAATAEKGAEAEVRLSSCFPWQSNTLFVPPPRSLWPPPPSPRVRWEGAQFVPLSLVSELIADRTPDEDQWAVDGQSKCLAPTDRPLAGPFRAAIRTGAAVDRLTQAAEPHSTACLEFAPDAGLWFAAEFSGDEARERWSDALKAAIRLLADSGFGGERSRGWGRAEQPEFADGLLPDLLLPHETEPSSRDDGQQGWWLLSLFSPSEADRVDWRRGWYSVVSRAGRVESRAGWGALKKMSRMVTEGSVLISGGPLRGAAVNVAPEGFPHPVFRSGLAVAVSIPLKAAS